MDASDIVSLFDYLYWLRDRALAQAEMVPADGLGAVQEGSRDLRSTLVHELDVERSWRLRLQGRPAREWEPALEPAAFGTADAIADAWRAEEEATRAWLADLTADQVGAPITINDLDGRPLRDYLIQVAMHGVQSFADAGILLTRAGHGPGDIDFLDHLDELTRDRPTDRDVGDDDRPRRGG